MTLSKTRLIPPECFTGFSIQIIFETLRSGGGGAVAKRMERPPLRNTGEGTKVESVGSKGRRQKVRYLAKRTG